MSPRTGSTNSIRTRPSVSVDICSRRPLRPASACWTSPMKSGGMSIVIRSYGSWTSPPTVRRITSGRLTVSSYPSRRICSISTASWSSPRPRTSNVSPDSVGWTSIETLPRTSFSRRALIWRDVTYLPSRPPSGDVLTPNVIDSVGASTSRRGNGRGSPGSVIVSPIVTSGRPATETISPGPGLGDVDALHPVRGLEAGDRPGERDHPAGLDSPAVSSASSRTTAIRWPTRIVPLRIRPTAIRPTYSFADRLVTRSWSGCPARTRAPA